MARCSVELAVFLLLATGPVAESQEACELDWRLEETLRIGSLDGDDALSWFPNIALGPSGEIYVPQPGSGSVLVFTSDGDFDRKFGRFGSGPGDFEAGPRVVTWARGELWVADRLRAQSFGPDDRPREFVQFQHYDAGEGIIFRPEAPLADGTMWAKQSLTPIPGNAGPETLAVRRFDREGSILDTIAVLDVRGDRVVLNQESGGFANNPLRTLLPGNANSRVRQSLSPDRTAFVLVGNVRSDNSPATFDLLRISIEGDTLLQRTIPYHAVPISRSERDWWIREFGATIAGDYSVGRLGFRQSTEAQRNRDRERARNALVLPEYYPPVRQIVAGENGTTWLLREPDVLGGSNRWDIYDGAGDLIGRVSDTFGRNPLTPWLPNLQVLLASSSELWGSTTDDLEVPYIHRFRIRNACE